MGIKKSQNQVITLRFPSASRKPTPPQPTTPLLISPRTGPQTPVRAPKTHSGPKNPVQAPKPRTGPKDPRSGPKPHSGLKEPYAQKTPSNQEKPYPPEMVSPLRKSPRRKSPPQEISRQEISPQEISSLRKSLHSRELNPYSITIPTQ